jgi:hypothetical protein
MADGSLIGMLAGGSPLAPQEVQGGIASTLASDPTRLAYSSGPVGQALGQISGGFYQGQATDMARQISQAHMDAMPSLAKAYASDDPYGTIANDPDASPYAKWMVLQQTPEQVADTKMRLGQAQTTQALLPKYKAIGQAAAGVGAQQPFPTVGGAAGPSAGGAPATGGTTGTAAPLPDPVDSAIAQMPPPGSARTAYLQNLAKTNPAVARGIIARLPRGPAAPAEVAAPATVMPGGPGRAAPGLTPAANSPGANPWGAGGGAVAI